MIRAYAEGATKPRYKSSTRGYGTGLLRSSPLHTSFLSSMACVCTKEDRTQPVNHQKGVETLPPAGDQDSHFQTET